MWVMQWGAGIQMQRKLAPIWDEYLDQLHYPLSLDVHKMLWLYMDDPFLTREEKPIADYKKKLVAELEDERWKVWFRCIISYV